MGNKKLSLSIVSHGNRDTVAELLADLQRLGRSDIEVILTLNLPETPPDLVDGLPFPVKLIANAFPKGFAANHNAAFAACQGDYFVLLNPDIRLPDDPFDILLAVIEQSPQSICAPSVQNDAGGLEDSARNFPSPLFLFKKLASKVLGFSLSPDRVAGSDDLQMPDWVAGMFIMVPRAIYRDLHGLSERYRLYYEDVDFCARARLAGCKVLVSRRARVIHHAQRTSHRNLRYLSWHLQSACKFFISAAYLKIQAQRWFGPRT
jgi:GT2 family glycosyltransferase